MGACVSQKQVVKVAPLKPAPLDDSTKHYVHNAKGGKISEDRALKPEQLQRVFSWTAEQRPSDSVLLNVGSTFTTSRSERSSVMYARSRNDSRAGEGSISLPGHLLTPRSVSRRWSPLPPRGDLINTLLEAVTVFQDNTSEQFRLASELLFSFDKTEDGDHQLELQRYKVGDKIFNVNDVSTGMYLVVSGNVGFSFVGKGGVQDSAQRLFAGEYFGEVELILGKHRFTNVIAVTNCVMIFVPRDIFDTKLLTVPGAVADFECKLEPTFIHLPAILHHSTCSKLFHAMLTEEKSTEQLDFWEQVQFFRDHHSLRGDDEGSPSEDNDNNNNNNTELLQKLVLDIVNQYLRTNAVSEINLSLTLRNELIAKAEAGNTDIELFQPAVRQVRAMLMQACLRFKDSPEFKHWYQQHAHYIWLPVGDEAKQTKAYAKYIPTFSICTRGNYMFRKYGAGAEVAKFALSNVSSLVDLHSIHSPASPTKRLQHLKVHEPVTDGLQPSSLTPKVTRVQSMF